VIDLRFVTGLLAAGTAAALLPYLAGRRTGRPASGRGRLVAPLRAAALACLVLLAGRLLVHQGGGRGATVVLADVSDSIRGERRLGLAEAARGDLAEGIRRGDATLIAFDGAAREIDPGSPLPPGSVPQTNLERAVRVALARFPEGGDNRLVILSDGKETGGSVVSTIPDLRRRGVTVHVRDLGEIPSGEVAVESIRVPPAVFIGQPFEVRASVSAGAETGIAVALLRDGVEVDRQEVQVPQEISTEVVFPRRETETGSRRYAVAVAGGLEDYPGNNLREAEVRVGRDLSVSVVTLSPATSEHLAAGLRGVGLRVSVREPEDCLARWGECGAADVLLLDDLPAAALGSFGMDMLEEAVRVGGKGLLAVGGKRSLGSGAWRDTPLERAMPAFMGAPDGSPKKELGLAVVLDTSLSMHFKGSGDPNAPRKIDVARQAIGQVAGALRPGDQLALLESADTVTWRRRLGPITSRPEFDRLLAGLSALGGGINFYSSILEAYNELQRSSLPYRHVMVVCDSNDIDQYEVANEGRSHDLIRAMEQRGITLSIFAIGNPADKDLSFLRSAAELGRGNFYLVSNLVFLPHYFVSDYQNKREAWVREEEFRPLIREYDPLLAGIPVDRLPPLGGVNLVSAKDGARVVLIAPFGAPVLAYWKYGRGRTAIFTSDAGGPWGLGWKGWPDAALFFGQMVHAVAPRADAGQAEVAGEAAGGRLRFRVRDGGGGLTDDPPRTVRLSAGMGPEGDELPLRRAGLDRWVAAGSLPPPGLYRFRIGTDNAREITGTVDVPPPDEYSPGGGWDVLNELAEATGGGWLGMGEPLPVLPEAGEGEGGAIDPSFWLALGGLVLLLAELLLRY
jgi:hypothetical protein